MATFLYAMLLAVGVAILMKSAEWFTEAAVETARRLRVPEMVVGITLVSFATTLPEFAVSFVAACVGKVEMAVGNAVGSTICNVGLILGLCAALSPMAVDQKRFIRNGVSLLVFSGIYGGLGHLFPEGGRWVGIVMLGCLAVYLRNLFRATRRHGREDSVAAPSNRSNWMVALLFVAGAGGVVGASRLVVYAAENLARQLGVPELVISLTLVAVGTSMPEFVVSLTAIVKKQRALSVGNIIGANILNLAWVLGASSLARPLPLHRQTLFFDIPMMWLMSVLLLLFGATDHRLARWEGLMLLAIYLFYVAMLFAVFTATSV